MEIILKDNRILAYAVSGDPGGKPVFLFHGLPGSRFFAPYPELTAKAGVRLITLDRPGYGGSTFQPHRRFLDWPADVLQVADRLGINTFAVAGHSGGGPYVAACAYALPDRVRAAAFICAAGPIESPKAWQHMDGLNRAGFRMGRFIPWPLWRLLIWIFFRDGYRRPETVMEREASSRPAADAELWKLDSVREVCYASTREAFRPGTTGHAWEARLLTRPWGIPLDRIRVPAHLWHGSADRTTPIAMAKTLAGRIPQCQTHYFEGEAHLLIFPHWQEILSVLVQEH